MPNPTTGNQQNRGLSFCQVADAWFDFFQIASVQEPGSRDPGFRSLHPGAWIQEPGSRSLDPGAWIQKPASRSLDPGSLDPGSLDPGLEITDALFECPGRHVKQQIRYLSMF